MFLHLLLDLRDFRFIGAGHLAHEHLPLAGMALLDQLLVDAEDADEDVLFVLAGTAGLDDGVVEADGVHVESFLDP